MTTFWCICNFRDPTIFVKDNPSKSMRFDDVVYRAFFWNSNRCRKANIIWNSWLHNPMSATIMM